LLYWTTRADMWDGVVYEGASVLLLLILKIVQGLARVRLRLLKMRREGRFVRAHDQDQDRAWVE